MEEWQKEIIKDVTKKWGFLEGEDIKVEQLITQVCIYTMVQTESKLGEKEGGKNMKEVNIVNLTSEAVVIYSKDGKRIKHTYPPSGDVAYIETGIGVSPRTFNGVPLVYLEYGEVKGFPQHYPEGSGMSGPAYIVDPDILKVIVRRDLLVSPDYSPESVVKNKDGEIIGVRRFVKRFGRSDEVEIQQAYSLLRGQWQIRKIGPERKCDNCGKKYKTYAIILDDNPLSIASFIEDFQNEDGTLKRLCEECYNKLSTKDNKI